MGVKGGFSNNINISNALQNWALYSTLTWPIGFRSGDTSNMHPVASTTSWMVTPSAISARIKPRSLSTSNTACGNEWKLRCFHDIFFQVNTHLFCNDQINAAFARQWKCALLQDLVGATFSRVFHSHDDLCARSGYQIHGTAHTFNQFTLSRSASY